MTILTINYALWDIPWVPPRARCWDTCCDLLSDTPRIQLFSLRIVDHGLCSRIGPCPKAFGRLLALEELRDKILEFIGRLKVPKYLRRFTDRVKLSHGQRV